ncbi:hypothetical protein EIN_173500 [Entamoeba invadens IP1]|uniref:Rab-GAP TBC domain-containing protein n=1 Tax=Entamoeba invadens IP1 TaxID=370355 RepID=A0A0A1TYN5_ENTIV|nr:hypothetical protein EIN_173500 [Entamoeba invadens IP1]ELP84675.1 hypothetical protein EIN_173500 [Entamoeba invadens IP1]|eukprot:XP_004184021.1 hypothetical protein EIN_173500 [Entamoeba invadens IP1]
MVPLLTTLAVTQSQYKINCHCCLKIFRRLCFFLADTSSIPIFSYFMEPLSNLQISSLMDKEGRISNNNMDILRRTLYYRGCEKDARELSWSLCLGYLNHEKTTSERKLEETHYHVIYEKTKSVWQNVIPEQKQNWALYKQIETQIDKDVTRTDKDEHLFQTDDLRHTTLLKTILMTYAFFNMRINYRQGMNYIVSGLMNVTTNENALFWLFKCVMDIIQPFYFCENDTIMRALKKNGCILKVMSPPLYKYLQQRDITYFFCFKWNALLFKRLFNEKDLLRVWDTIFAFPNRKMFYYITAAILKEYTTDIVSCLLSFDELMLFIQKLNGTIGDGIVYQADVVYQEFKKTADSEIVQYVYEKFSYKPAPKNDIRRVFFDIYSQCRPRSYSTK